MASCVNCASPLGDRPQCGRCGLFAPAAPRHRAAAPRHLAAAPEDGSTRTRVRLTGIRSYMAAVRSAEQDGGPLPLATVVPGGPTPVVPQTSHGRTGVPAEERIRSAPRPGHPGTRLAGPPPTYAPAPQPAPVPQPPAYATRPAGPAPRPARRPRPVPLDNPWRRLRPSDGLADLAALVLLVLTPFLPWDASRSGHEAWWVVAVAALAGLSLLTPYVMTSRLVPAFRPEHSAVLTFALGTPAFAVALGAVLTDLVSVTSGLPGGIGVGVATLVAGAALAVVPRAAEEVLGPVAERPVAATAVVAGVSAVALQVVAFAVHVGHGSAAGLFAGQRPGDWVVLVVLTLVLPLTLLGVPAVSHAMGRTSGRRVIATVGAASLTVTVLAALGVPSLGSWAVVESWLGPSGGAYVVGAAATLALSGAAARRTGAGVDPAVGWQQTARLALWVCAGGALGELLVAVAVLAPVAAAGATEVAVVALLAAVVLLATIGAVLLVDLRRRTTVVVLVGLVLASAVVVWALAPGGLTPTRGTVLVALPLLAGGALLAPAVVRHRVRSLRVVPSPASWAPPAPRPRPVVEQPRLPQQPWGAAEDGHTVPRVFAPAGVEPTFVQSTGATQARRMPRTQPAPIPGQPWNGWRAGSAS